MTYANPILAFGDEAFVRKAAEVGVDGLIVVDLPPEEGSGVAGALPGERNRQHPARCAHL